VSIRLHFVGWYNGYCDCPVAWVDINYRFEYVQDAFFDGLACAKELSECVDRYFQIECKQVLATVPINNTFAN
jgi:hypothetical protein